MALHGMACTQTLVVVVVGSPHETSFVHYIASSAIMTLVSSLALLVAVVAVLIAVVALVVAVN